MGIPADLRWLVAERAGGHCEYCKLPQAWQEATFHIDHIIPISAGGSTEFSNLAFACVSCSLRKGSRENVADPDSDMMVRISHPRIQIWNDHFKWEGVRVVGTTPTGRTTVDALQMNRRLILAIRQRGGWDANPPG